MGYTNFPNGLTSFGVPLPAGNGVPTFGTTYFVDGTNGSDSNNGKEITKAFATIQKAIDIQTADTTGLGDTIYVMPGVYAEGLTGTLTKVSLIAVGGNYGNGPNAAVIYHATKSGLSNITTNGARISNFTFVSPSTSTTLPAVHFANMRWTTFDNNALIGGAAACITGLQVGVEAATDTACNCDFNLITGNYFGTVFGAASEFAYGIKVGRVAYVAGALQRHCMSTVISYNQIAASTNGIYLGVHGDHGNGTIIHNNFITGWEGADDEGCSGACIEADNPINAMVVNNSCTTAAASAAIVGFHAGNVLHNWTGQNGSGKLETIVTGLG